MHDNLIRPDLVGPVLAQTLGDARWEELDAVLRSLTEGGWHSASSPRDAGAPRGWLV